MPNWIRFINQNQFEILIFISVIAFAIFFINSLKNIYNERANENTEYSKYELNSMEENITNTISNENKVFEDDKEKIFNVMDDFVYYCNHREYEQAYQLLTDECKQNTYKTVNIFYNRYIKYTFSEYLDYTMILEEYTNRNYKYTVTFKTNAMVSINSNNITKTEIYEFVIQNDETFKINIL